MTDSQQEEFERFATDAQTFVRQFKNYEEAQRRFLEAEDELNKARNWRDLNLDSALAIRDHITETFGNFDPNGKTNRVNWWKARWQDLVSFVKSLGNRK